MAVIIAVASEHLASFNVGVVSRLFGGWWMACESLEGQSERVSCLGEGGTGLGAPEGEPQHAALPAGRAHRIHITGPPSKQLIHAVQ